MKNKEWKVFAEKLKQVDADTRKEIERMINTLLENQKKTNKKKKEDRQKKGKTNDYIFQSNFKISIYNILNKLPFALYYKKIMKGGGKQK